MKFFKKKSKKCIEDDSVDCTCQSKSTSEGRLYYETEDFFSCCKIKKQIQELVDSELHKNIVT